MPKDKIIFIDNEALVPLNVFRRYPAILYTYMGGAVAFAASMMLSVQNPSVEHAITMAVSAVVLLVGYIQNRRYMKLANAAINNYATAKMVIPSATPPAEVIEESADDTGN